MVFTRDLASSSDYQPHNPETMLETLIEIDNVVLDFSENGKNILNLTIAFIMFGVALELKWEDFVSLFKRPKPALVGILSQFILMPLLTFLLTFSLQSFITPTIGLGMILVAACPGGNISNFMSSLAKGNVNRSTGSQMLMEQRKSKKVGNLVAKRGTM